MKKTKQNKKQAAAVVFPVFADLSVEKKKISSVSEERNKNAEGSNNKAAELLVCPGGRGRYGGHSLFKKSHSSQQME